MGSYKGIEVEDGLLNLLPHMQLVEEYRESLQNLQAVWDNLNLLGHRAATTTDRGSTRAAFSAVTSSRRNSEPTTAYSTDNSTFLAARAACDPLELLPPEDDFVTDDESDAATGVAALLGDCE